MSFLDKMKVLMSQSQLKKEKKKKRKEKGDFNHPMHFPQVRPLKVGHL